MGTVHVVARKKMDLLPFFDLLNAATITMLVAFVDVFAVLIAKLFTYSLISVYPIFDHVLEVGHYLWLVLAKVFVKKFVLETIAKVVDHVSIRDVYHNREDFQQSVCSSRICFRCLSACSSKYHDDFLDGTTHFKSFPQNSYIARANCQ